MIKFQLESIRSKPNEKHNLLIHLYIAFHVTLHEPCRWQYYQERIDMRPLVFKIQKKDYLL